MNPQTHNIGAYVKSAVACAGRLVAAGAGDATKVTGVSIDRAAPGGKIYGSCVIAIAAEAVLAAGKTLAFALEYQTSDDGSSYDTAVVLQASTVLLTDSGSGSTLQGILEFDLDLTGLKRFVRFNPTPDLNATGTDTAHWGAVCTLGAPNVLPA